MRISDWSSDVCSSDLFAQLRLKQHDEDTLEALERATLDHPAIVECFSMSGEYDYMMRIVVGSIEEYEMFLKKVLLHLPGVASINSSFALQRIKMTTSQIGRASCRERVCQYV